MFINFTNHLSSLWSEIQVNASKKYGIVKDLPFPSVDPVFTSQDIIQIAEDYTTKIMDMHPKAVLVQGEMTLCFHVVNLLKKENITVLCACSQRVVTEEKDDEGNTVKKSLFQFVQYREY